MRYMMAGAVEEPGKCSNTTCSKTMTMQLMHNFSEYNNKQLIKMQVLYNVTHSIMQPCTHSLMTCLKQQSL